MKKLISMMLIFALALTLVACEPEEPAPCRPGGCDFTPEWNCMADHCGYSEE